MKRKIHPILRLFEPVVDAIAETMGKYSEVVLHDFSDLEHSIVKIVNGHITGRKVGDPITDLGLKILKSQSPEGDFLPSYFTRTKSGKPIRSNSVIIRDTKGKIIGGLCINIDLSAYQFAFELLQQMCSIGSEDSGIKETFENDVGKLLDDAIKDVIDQKGKSIVRMDSFEKQELVKELESKGIFLIKGALNKVANGLGISRASVYKYLERIRSHQ